MKDINEPTQSKAAVSDTESTPLAPPDTIINPSLTAL